MSGTNLIIDCDVHPSASKERPLEPYVPAAALLEFYAIEIPYLRGLLSGAA